MCVLPEELELQAFDSCRDAVSAYGSFHVFGQRSEKDLGYSQAKHNRRILTLDQANSAQAISTDDIGQASNQPWTKPSSDLARFVDQAGTRQHDKCIHQARQVPTKQHRPSKHRPSTINPSSSHEAEAHQATNKTAKVRAPCNHNCMAVASDHVMVARICFQKKSSSEQSSS